MATSTDPHWWQLHFSSLGAGGGTSGIVFNCALIVGGLFLTTLGFTIGHDLRDWKASLTDHPRRRPWVIQWSSIALGIALAGIGFVPTIVSPIIHRVFDLGAALTFGLLLMSARWTLVGFSRAFLVFCDALTVLLVLTASLYYPAHSYSLAAFELLAAGIAFAWIIVFVRQLIAFGPASLARQP